MDKITLTGVITASAPTDAEIKHILEPIEKLETKFDAEDLERGLLGGLRPDGSVWVQRGLRGQFKGVKATVDDLRVDHPIIEVYLDESKLDERAKFQNPLLTECLQKNEGIIVSPTGSGKTVMEVMTAVRLQRRTLILTQLGEIAKQTRDAIKNLTGMDAGWIGDGVRDIRPITVGMVQSVRSTDPILKEIGTLIIDEAHHISATSYLKILAACPAKYRYGFTATIRKTKDTQKIIFAAIGPILGEIEVKELQEAGHLNTGVVRWFNTGAVAARFDCVVNRCWYFKGLQKKEKPGKPCPAPCTYPVDDDTEKCVYLKKGYFAWVYDRLSSDILRNAMIVSKTTEVISTDERWKKQPWAILLTHLKKHTHILAEQLKAVTSDVTAVWHATGTGGKYGMPEKQKDAAIEAFRSTGGILVCTSGCIGEGFNAAKTWLLVRAMPSGGRVSVRQHTGRIMRPQPFPSLILDFADPQIPWLNKMAMGRRSICKAIGFPSEAKDNGEQKKLF